jgi:SanA protein
VIRRLFSILFFLLLVLAAGFAVCVYIINQAAKGRVYDRADLLPPRVWGLVLGTSEHRRDGGDNPYFKYRIEAAAKLYRLGKVKRLLVSGDNHLNSYNEPADMRRALIAQNVPAGVITLDYAGLRTLDSIVRAEKVFGLARFTIISQRDHDERALLIAKHYGIDAIAYAADDVPFQYAQRAHIHEWLAEMKVVLDLFVLHTKPRYLGARQVVR